MRIVVTALLVAATAVAVSAQRPSFEVATIKRNTTVNSGGGGGMAPGGRFRMVNVDVQTLILIAYRTGTQLFPSQVIGVPDWASSEYYDITAKVGDDLAGKPMPELFRLQPLLLQSLLEDRLKLKLHKESRETARYRLVVAGSDGALGPQLRKADVDCAAAPQRCGVQAAPGRFVAGSVPISALISFLAPNQQRVVVDRTGLEGRYSITLEWTPDRATLPLGGDVPPPSDKPPLVTALQDQLGLKLESERGPVDVLVIEHVERPTED